MVIHNRYPFLDGKTFNKFFALRPDELLINSEVLSSHLGRRKACLKLLADRRSVQTANLANCSHRAFNRVHNKSGDAFVDDLWNRTFAPGDNRRTGRHGFDHDKTKRFRPVDGKEQRKRIAEKLIFFMVADLADEFDKRVVVAAQSHA
jgi:hypothetical protein